MAFNGTDPTVRWYQRIYNNFVWEDYPIHFAGATLFVFNGSTTQVATVTIARSTDGVTYTPITFSTPALAGQTQIALQPYAYGTMLFTSVDEYFRVSVADANGDPITEGVYVWLVEYPPLQRDTAVGS